MNTYIFGYQSFSTSNRLCDTLSFDDDFAFIFEWNERSKYLLLVCCLSTTFSTDFSFPVNTYTLAHFHWTDCNQCWEKVSIIHTKLDNTNLCACGSAIPSTNQPTNLIFTIIATKPILLSVISSFFFSSWCGCCCCCCSFFLSIYCVENIIIMA